MNHCYILCPLVMKMHFGHNNVCLVTKTMPRFSQDTRLLRTLELLGEWSDKGQILLFVERQEACDDLMTQLRSYGSAALLLYYSRA